MEKFIATAGALCCWFTAGCSDTTLGKGFKPGDVDTNTTTTHDFLAPRSLHFFMARSLQNSDGQTPVDRKVAGDICVRIDAVNEDYAAGIEAVAVGYVRVAGTGPGSDFYISGNEVDWAQLETDHAAFWQRSLTMAPRGHGYLAPKTLSLATRRTVTPPEQGLTHMPLYDARVRDDGTWRGWTDYLQQFYAYFSDRFGDLSTHPDVNAPPARSGFGCENATDQGSCTAGVCLWDFASNTCKGVFSVEVFWREQVQTPPELAGTVLRRLLVKYTAQGVLEDFQETIIPDPNPAAPVAPFQECTGTGWCANARIQLSEAPWASTAPCRF